MGNQSQLKDHTMSHTKSSSTSPSMSMYQPQYMLMLHTTYQSQPQSKVNQSSKELLAQLVLSTPTKTELPQLSTPVPSTEVPTPMALLLPQSLPSELSELLEPSLTPPGLKQ